MRRLPVFRPSLVMERHTSVEDVPLEAWASLAPRASVGLEAAHLRAVEVSGINDLRPYYLVAWSGGELAGIAYAFAMDMDLSTLGTDELAGVLSAVRTWRPDFLKTRILEVGHIATLGRTLAFEAKHRETFLQALAAELDLIAVAEKAQLGIIRDLEAEAYGAFRDLEQEGWRPTAGFPIAVLELRWPSFEGYVAALKSKRRCQIRAWRRALADGITVELIDDYGPCAERLAELWGQVSARHAEYDHEVLTADFFRSMARHLPGRSHVIALKRDGRIVSFGLGLIGDEEYFGAAEGMDYSQPDTVALYANTLLETVRVAARMGKRRVNLGITTYDFKAALGAELDPVVYLVKDFVAPEHSAAWAELLGRGIEQPENHHRAFAHQRVSGRLQPREVTAALRASGQGQDPFSRHARYTRADMARVTGLYAYCPAFESAQEPVMERAGREVVMLGTNSYLGLATHARVKAAAAAALERYGTGCSGSPLLNGTLDLHEELRGSLASFARKEDALVFSTGYQTNVGVISALVGRGDVVLMDERNHASLIDGARLSGATVVRYRHADLDSLAARLAGAAGRSVLVVSDSLFSMEGTVVDLPAVVAQVRRHGARLMLDESHALGVMGPTGRGVAEHFGLLEEVDVLMATFSKSLASVGGFVAGERQLIDVLRHTARSHVFSASLPPASVAAALEALRLVDEEPWRRTRLLANARSLARDLAALGYPIHHQGNAIVRLHCGSELLALALFHRLLEEGVFVNPVTWPAVPRGDELLRISLMATHEPEQLQRALDAFDRARTPTWPTPSC